MESGCRRRCEQDACAFGLLDAAILTRYEGALRPEDKRWPDWINGQTKKIEGVLAQLEAEANSLKGKPAIGTISVACALGYLDYRFAAMDWRAKHPKLAKWFNSIAKTPAMEATQPPAAWPGRATADEIIAGPPGGPTCRKKGSYPRESWGVEQDPSGERARRRARTPGRACSTASRSAQARPPWSIASRQPRSALDGTHRQCGRYAPAVRYVFTPVSDPGEHVADRRREQLAAASRRDTRSLRALAMARSEIAPLYTLCHWASLTPGCGALLGEFELVHALGL
jgi:hypothetical protein